MLYFKDGPSGKDATLAVFFSYVYKPYCQSAICTQKQLKVTAKSLPLTQNIHGNHFVVCWNQQDLCRKHTLHNAADALLPLQICRRIVHIK